MAYTSKKKPLELTALTSLATDDTIIVGDTSDTNEVVKAITKANLITDLGSSFATATQGAKADTATQPADIANFETTTQLDTRDTNNRARANHTGTQTASTISDFASAALTAAPAETGTTLGVLNAGATSKTTPVNADSFPIVDSEASNILKRLTFTNLKTFLKTYFDTLYPSGSGTSTGTNTGDNATNSQYSGLVTNATHTGDATGATALTVVKINGTLMSGLATGVLKNTTSTGVPFISKVALTEPATSATLTIADGKTLTANNSIALTGTDSTTMTFPTTSATIARTDAAQTFTGVQTMTSPDHTTSVTTASTSFTAYAGATTLLTIGGTGASASLFAPSTLDTTSSTTGAIRTSGGISAAKAANIGTSLTVGTTIELGHASDTTLSRTAAGTVAVEGVRVRTTTPLVVSAASYTTDTGTSLNMDNLDMFVITAQAGALLFNAPGGTLVQGRTLTIRIKDNGTARALTWNAVFRAMGTALPSTTVVSKTLYLGFFYNSTDTKWDLVASAVEA